jgi:hypothetical protein
MSETDNLETGAKDAEVDVEKQVEPYIIEQHNYFDETGRVVMENRLISGTRPENQSEFVGHGKLTATAPPPVGNAEATFAFEIAGAESVEDAFAKFDAAIEEKRPKYLQEFREMIQQQVMAAREAASKIITAQGMDLNDLQMPGSNGAARGGPKFRL